MSSRGQGPSRKPSKSGDRRGPKTGRGGSSGRGAAKDRSSSGGKSQSGGSRRTGQSDKRSRDDRDGSGRNSRGARTSTNGAHAARRGETPKKPVRAERSGWGSVARHGAVGATIGQRQDEVEAAENERFNQQERAKFEKRQARRDAVAARQDDLRTQAQKAIDRGGVPADGSHPSKPSKVTVERRPLPGRPPNPRDIPKEMARKSGKQKGERSWKVFKRGAREFEEERFTDSLRTVKPLAKDYADIVEVQELYGLCLYRLGRWDEAIEVLELFRQQGGTAEQNPVLMDCHRAVGNWADVSELWDELGDHSPSAELMAEGRIVMAGGLADQGNLDEAIRLLEKGWKPPRVPQPYHMRRAYLLADMLDRRGKIPRSRKLFAWIAAKDENYLDASERSIG